MVGYKERVEMMREERKAIQDNEAEKANLLDGTNDPTRLTPDAEFVTQNKGRPLNIVEQETLAGTNVEKRIERGDVPTPPEKGKLRYNERKAELLDQFGKSSSKKIENLHDRENLSRFFDDEHNR